MYDTKFMSKSLTLSNCWLGTEPFYRHYEGTTGGGVQPPEAHHEWLKELAQLIDEGKIKTHLTRRAKLTLAGLQEAHRLVESGKSMGKFALAVDEEGEGEAFC